ncbi:protease inhibitor I42 family protein [Mycobacterium intermedium]
MCCLLLVAGCSSARYVTVNDSDNGRHIELKSGQTLDIVLADDYETSHHQWRDEQTYDTSVLEPLGMRFEPERKPPGGGEGGTFTSKYRAGRAGTVHVTLVQADNSDHVARRFAIDVTVR